MGTQKKIYLLLIILLSLFARFYHLGNIPSSLYTDETDFGYNAYSILKTGYDEHGTFLPISLRSFGDWKSPLPSYFVIPSIVVLGLSEFAVRLPSALLGVTSVALIYYLVKELLPKGERTEKISLLSAFFLAISPWHILQSRAALPMIPGSFLLIAGIYFFLLARHRSYFFILSAIFFGLSLYDYLSFFIVTPLILLILIIYSSKSIKSYKITFLAGVAGLLIVLPLIIASLKQPDIIFGRAKNLSVFSDPGIMGKYWDLANKDKNPWITKLIHNKYELYAESIALKFVSHLNPKYLFLKGDASPPFQIPNMGILYIFDLVFLLIGLFILFKKRLKIGFLLIVGFCISLIPAALTFQTPASNRSFNAVISVVIIISIGLAYSLRLIKLKTPLVIIFSFAYTLSFGYFLYQYFIILPRFHADWWNFGWKDVVSYMETSENKYKNVVISDVNGMPYIYFLFYKKYDPAIYQKEALRDYKTDQYGYEHVQGFGKYTFLYKFDWEKIRKNKKSDTLYVVPAWQASQDTNFIKAIYYPDGKIAYKIFVNDK